MNKELKNVLGATESKAQYDASAKRLLGQKSILAHILVKTVDEFQGMNPREVERYIEGTPCISTVPVEPGLTNVVRGKNGERLTGFNTESGELQEGLVRFDIVFYVSRLISSQKERDFENSSYDDMKRVYSIWVCMNMEENTMSHIHLTKDDLIGRHDWKGKLDLLNIVMIGLAKELPEHSEMYELHRLLGALLSNRLSLGEKLDIIGGEYAIPMEEDLRKDVSAMCNLSQGIEEEGIAIGHAAGLEEGRTAGLAEGREAGLAEGHEAGFIEGEAGLILKMYKNGFTAEQIAAATDKDIEEVERLIADKDIIAVE